MSTSSPSRRARWAAAAVAGAAVVVVVPGMALASAPAQPRAAAHALPASLRAEIAANNAAGLPGLNRGVTIPAGCDIRTSLDSNGRPRIERERTQHRLLNHGQSAVWIADANAQLQAYLQAATRDYCASHS